MIPVLWLFPQQHWDQNMIGRLLCNKLYDTGLAFKHVYMERGQKLPKAAVGDTLVLVVPGRWWVDYVDDITKIIAPFDRVVAIRTGDEEDLFDIHQVKHPQIKWWVQTPRTDRDYGDARLFGVGFTPQFNDLGPVLPPKTLELFLSAQNTHERRHQCFEQFPVGRDGPRFVHASEGFTQGVDHKDYAELMVQAKVAPAPAGAVCPDSFRLYEALEAHAIPIADELSPAYPSWGYWRLLFPDAPFPVLSDWANGPGLVEDLLSGWPANANRVAAYWMGYKRQLVEWLREDLGQSGLADYRITTLVSSSPIKSHPDTHVLEETIESIRRQVFTEIILMFDGVRPEQENRREDYEEYIRRALWLCDHKWGTVLPLVFDDHLHQGACTKRALEHVNTPHILYVEHDTPLTGNIPWFSLQGLIEDETANLIRFHHEHKIPEEHNYLMLDRATDLPMTQTLQWSQRPHLAKTEFYQSMLDRCFPDDEKNFIEDVVYTHLANTDHWGWWKTWIFTPTGGDIRRSYHLNGRAGEDKFDR